MRNFSSRKRAAQKMPRLRAPRVRWELLISDVDSGVAHEKQTPNEYVSHCGDPFSSVGYSPESRGEVARVALPDSLSTEARKGRMRVVLVDDETLFRETLKQTFERGSGDIEVVGEAASAHDALFRVDELDPDVVVVDAMLPGSQGVFAARAMIKRDARRRVLLLSHVWTEDLVRRSFQSGALGFGLKTEGLSELVRALGAVGRREFYLAPSVPSHVLHSPPAPEGRSGRALDLLSWREREVFDLAVRNLSNDGIGKKLFISRKTVETHRANINRKLSVHSTGELIRYAWQEGALLE